MSYGVKIINIHFPERRNWWLLFGVPGAIRPVTRGDSATRAELVTFSSGELFGISHQTLNTYGITDWEIWFLQAPRPGEVASLIPGVRPGAKILLYAQGKKQARAVLDYLDLLDGWGLRAEALGELHRVCAPYLERGVIPHELIERHLGRTEGQ